MKINKKILMALVATAMSVCACAQEVKKSPFDGNPTAVNIQRTLKMMEESTAENPAHIKVLFYGQSITAQEWTHEVVDLLKKSYPTVKFTFDKFSIGGFTSDALYRTALTDLYPYYPDLLFFHVYGSFEKYEEIVSKTKQLTAADVVLWSSHLARKDSLEQHGKGPDDRTKKIEAIAKRWNCMYIDLHGQWCDMLKRNKAEPGDLLRDGIHLNPRGCHEYAKIVKDEIVRIPGAGARAGVSGTIVDLPVKSPSVVARADGGYEVTFTGNRLVAEFDGTGAADAAGSVTIDGKPVTSLMNSWISTRPTAWPIWMPVIRHIDFTTTPVEEDWTLTCLPGTAADGSVVHFRVQGSRTGVDGEGWSTNDFVSTSRRAIIRKSDWGWPWQVSYENGNIENRNKKRAAEGKELLKKLTVEPGREIKWQTKSILESPFGVTKPMRRVLVQGAEVGTHKVVIHPKSKTNLGIVKFIAYGPGAAALKTQRIHAPASRELVVSPNGLSPQQALEKIRAEKIKGDTLPWTVRVKAGHYTLTEPLTFTAEDSGSAASPVTWIGEDGAVIAGGAQIKGWKNIGGGVWSADLPLAPNGEKAYFEQLWVNGRRADRARLPNKGYFKVKNPHISQEKVAAANNCRVEKFTITNMEASVLAKIPADEFQYAQACVIHKWSFGRRILRGYDPQSGEVETWNPQDWASWKRWSEKETIVCFENVRSAFDAPGEWFYDAKAGKVLYRPLPGEDMTKVSVVAPSSALSQLVVFAANPSNGECVHDIHFKNMCIAYSASTPSGKTNAPTECQQLQAASHCDGAITLSGAKNVSFDNCQVKHTGNYGMRFNNGCVWNSVRACTLEDVGAGGIWMGAQRGYVAKGETLSRRLITTLAPESTAFNRIENCLIHIGGRFNPEGTGVALTHASDCKVLHNEIHDFYYTGVSVGWTWGFSGSVAQRNEIAYNKIYDLGKSIMSDMGGVYTLATSYGTTVHDNVIHDVWSYSYGGWALYTDEGSEGIIMERNVCWNTTDGGFHQHFGTGCIIRNNIFAWNKMLGAVRMQRNPVFGIPCSLHFVNNIVLVREGPLAGKGVRNVGGVWANNLWWDVSGKPELDGLSWQAWVKSGKESGSKYADPQFVNAAAYDFRLKSSSPAFALGFKEWDFTTAGRQK